MKCGVLFGLVLLSSVAPAHAGVTIHFEGELAQAARPEDVAERACQLAAVHNWRCVQVNDIHAAELDGITRAALEENAGRSLEPVRGAVIYPAEMSEPLFLVFTPEGRLANFIKTQFAGLETHVKVAELLKALAASFARLDVEDEGGYYATGDRAALRSALGEVEAGIAELKAKHPSAQGPIRRPDGRILDLVSGGR